MKTSIKKEDKCQVKLTVTLDAEEVKVIVKDVERAYMREAQIPGFRKGKVPMEIIRREFKDQMKNEIQRAMFQKNYADAVKAEKLDEVALANVEELKYDENGGSFVATVEVKPTFKLPTYKGLNISAGETTVKEEAVQDQLNRLRVAYAKYEDAKDGETVADGDFVQLDYEGTVGGKKILEINAEAKIVGEGKGFWTQVEDGRFLPEILEAVKGMKIGETKNEIQANFDKETAPEGLKGEKAIYTITVVALRKRVMPTDTEFIEKAKAESIEKLTATIRESLEKSAVRQEEARRENEAVEALLKKADFDVPESQVRRAMDGYLNELAQRAQYSGLDAKYFEEHREQILKDAEEAATKQVRLWYILDGIAAEEKIEAKDEEKGKKVIDFVLANAK